MKYTVSTRKRSDTWSYQIFIDGSYYSSKSGFKTKMDAKKAGDKAAVKIKTPTRSKDDFLAIAKLYIADGIKEPTTIETYNRWLKVFEPVYDVEMLKLTYQDVAPVINEYYLTHKYNGTQSILRFGKSIVDFAINKLDYDMRNPFSKITLEKKSDKGKKQHRILTMDEMKILFDKIDNPEIRFLTMCFGLAGLRLSEARGLMFKNFKSDILIVEKQRVPVTGKILHKNTMKSHNSAREVPIDPDLKKAFKEIPRSIGKTDLIIDKFYASNAFSKVYRKLGYDVTPHSFRHAYATYCIQMGIDFKTVSELIGDDVKMVMDTYSHVNADMKERARKILTKI